MNSFGFLGFSEKLYKIFKPIIGLFLNLLYIQHTYQILDLCHLEGYISYQFFHNIFDYLALFE